MPSKESQSKTSKTARVMNLLSKKPDPAAASDSAENSASVPVPPIISSLAPDAEASVQIKNALENALAGELATETAPPVTPERSAPAEPHKEPAAVEAEPAASEPETPSTPAPVHTAEPKESETPRFVEPENPGYINVMQVLVEEKAPKYIQMFGLCQCKRCLEDVKALTLNHLPPKYVVLADGDRVPRLTVYEGRYGSDITAQLLHACTAVMQRPHHGR